MKRHHLSRRGISLIETIACVAIIATMATSIVGVMQNSVRVASASRGELGAPAQARQALRLLSDRMRRWNETDGITQVQGSVVNAGPHRYSFRRVTSATGVGHDLNVVDELGNESVFVSGSLVNYSIAAVPSPSGPVGVEIRLQLRLPPEQASSLRPHQRTADVSTWVCFPPQFSPQL